MNVSDTIAWLKLDTLAKGLERQNQQLGQIHKDLREIIDLLDAAERHRQEDGHGQPKG